MRLDPLALYLLDLQKTVAARAESEKESERENEQGSDDLSSVEGEVTD